MSPWQKHNASLIDFRLGFVRRSVQGLLYTRETQHNWIMVRRRRNEVTLGTRDGQSGEETIQSRLNIQRPLHLSSPYTKAMLLPLFGRPAPKKILAVGLGGGRLQMFLHHMYPDVEIHTVEIDPIVYQVSVRFFGFSRESDRQHVFFSDARDFLRECQADSKYDVILLDAYQAGGAPLHLLSYEFYRDCRLRLEEDGVVISNLHDSSRSYQSARRTFAAAFRDTTTCAASTGNVIVIGGRTCFAELRARISEPSFSKEKQDGQIPFLRWAEDVLFENPYDKTAPMIRDGWLCGAHDLYSIRT